VKLKKALFTILIIIMTFSVMAPALNAPSYYGVKKGQTVEYTSGRAGVTFTYSYFNGTVKVKRISFSKAPGENKPKFTYNPFDVRLTDSKGNTVTHVLGPVYVFFKVRQKDLRLWERGILTIMYFDTWKQEWRECYTFEVRDDGKVSNLACRIRVFGLYALARK